MAANQPAAPSAESTTAPNESIDEARAAGRAEALATALPRAQAAEVARLCTEGGVPEMIAGLLAEGATAERTRGRIEMAGQIKDLVALARRSNPEIPEATASALIAEGKTVEQARAALFDKMVARDEETVVSTQRVPGRTAGGGGREATLSNMRAQLERRGLLTKGA